MSSHVLEVAILNKFSSAEFSSCYVNGLSAYAISKGEGVGVIQQERNINVILK